MSYMFTQSALISYHTDAFVKTEVGCTVIPYLYRLLYDICRCRVQFVMPMLVVLGVYISIFWRLKNRPISKNSANYKRRRRTNIMVISVSVTFFLSWLPLNTLNFLLEMDVKSENMQRKEVKILNHYFNFHIFLSNPSSEQY